jgi:uncharacterized protein (DUF427 family)
VLKPSGDAIACSSAQRKIEIMWEFIGRKRPSFAEVPGPGQESVWDYHRPPKLVADKRHVVVRLGETVIADSRATVRILETAGPPTFYIPPKDVRGELLRAFPGESICEWKGTAKYWALKTLAPAREAIAWSYATAQDAV